MFKLLILAAFVGLALAVDSDAVAETKLLENDITPEGEFRFAYQTSNGIDVQSAGNEHVIFGSYKYISPEGQAIALSYTADENGYQPQGEHLPTSPPIPEAIIRAIEWNNAHPEAPEKGKL